MLIFGKQGYLNMTKGIDYERDDDFYCGLLGIIRSGYMCVSVFKDHE